MNTLPGSALPATSSFYTYRNVVLQGQLITPNPCPANMSATLSPAGVSCCPVGSGVKGSGVGMPCWLVPPDWQPPPPKKNAPPPPYRPVHPNQRKVLTAQGTSVATQPPTTSTPWTTYLILGGLGYGGYYLWKKHKHKLGA